MSGTSGHADQQKGKGEARRGLFPRFRQSPHFILKSRHHTQQKLETSVPANLKGTASGFTCFGDERTAHSQLPGHQSSSRNGRTLLRNGRAPVVCFKRGSTRLWARGLRVKANISGPYNSPAHLPGLKGCNFVSTSVSLCPRAKRPSPCIL